jgi:hypothetical protein
MDKPDYTHLKPGVEAGWRWGNGIATGTILSIHPERTEIISKGSFIARNGTTDNPAVIIQHKNGNQVLKLASELQTLQ